jgi:hypothetical protein
MNITLVLVTSMAFLIAILFSIYSWNRYRPVSYALLIWFFIAFGLAQIPYFQNAKTWMEGDWKGFLAFGSLLMLPVLVLVISWLKNQKFKNFLDQIPTWLLISTQAYRFAGIFFLVFYVQDKLPFEIGVVNGLLDVTVATSAIILGLLIYSKGNKYNKLVLAWNGLGLLDFASAFTVVGLTFFDLLTVYPAPTPMGLPPLTLISIFQVPIAMFIHIYLINRVKNTNRITNTVEHLK